MSDGRKIEVGGSYDWCEYQGHLLVGMMKGTGDARGRAPYVVFSQLTEVTTKHASSTMIVHLEIAVCVAQPQHARTLGR